MLKYPPLLLGALGRVKGGEFWGLGVGGAGTGASDRAGAPIQRHELGLPLREDWSRPANAIRQPSRRIRASSKHRAVLFLNLRWKYKWISQVPSIL